MDRTQNVILATLVNHETGAHTLMAHMKPEFFQDDAAQKLFIAAHTFISSYQALPPKDALLISAEKMQGVSEETYRSMCAIAEEIYKPEFKKLYEDNREWVMKEAEDFCAVRSASLGVIKCIDILNGKRIDGKLYDKGAIPKIMQDALSVSFSQAVGHDYFEDANSRYEFYHLKENRVKTGIDLIDQITKGGFPRKTLNLFMLPTGVGKTAIMCSLSAHMMVQGSDVLYITCEMAAERISERIDANLMDYTIESIHHLPHETFMKKIGDLKDKSRGRLIVKEYPPGMCSVNHIRRLLDELKLKKKFRPVVLVIDYIALMQSVMFKSKDSMYAYGKSLAEEVRGLLVEYDMVGISGAQTNRDGQDDADLSLDAMSESHGVSMTADFILAGISTEALEQMQQLRMKQLKNRYGPLDQPRTFLCGLDRSKMRLYNLSGSQSQPQKPLPPQGAIVKDDQFTKPKSKLKRADDSWVV